MRITPITARSTPVTACIGWTWEDEVHNRVCEFEITAKITPGSCGSYDEPPYPPGIDDMKFSLYSIILYNSAGEAVVTKSVLPELDRTAYEAAFEKIVMRNGGMLSQIEDRLREEARWD